MANAKNGAANGALIGLAVSDALGTALEFSRQDQAPWGPPKLFPLTLESGIVGGGPFHVLPGQVTDDTMMAVCLARSLKFCEGFDCDDVGARYVDWSHKTFDIGGQTRGSLSRINVVNPSAGPAISAGKSHWVSTGKNAAGNGSLMRTAPIGVFFAGDMPGIVAASLADSYITHFDPRCALACAAFNCAIGVAVEANGGSAETIASTMLTAAVNGLHLAVGMMIVSHEAFEAEVVTALEVLMDDLVFAVADDPKLYESPVHLLQSQGFVRVAFRLAFWQLMHASTFADGVLDSVNRGGDADTNGAIVGALLGARFGYGAIPEAWVKKVLECDPPAPFNATGDLHPQRLLEMLEQH